MTRKQHRARLAAALPNMTPAIKALDRDDATGLPVPMNAFTDRHGETDFGRVNGITTAALATERKCSVCGEPLEEFWFRISKPPGRRRFKGNAGLSVSHLNPFAVGETPPQVLTAAPVHLECLRFSATACPVMHAQGTQYAARVTRFEVIPGAKHGDAPTYRVHGPTAFARIIPAPVARKHGVS